MRRFLSILLASLVLCAACATGVSAAPKKTFNPDAITQCMLANDTRGILGNGHLAVVLVDENSYANFYAYRRSGLVKVSYTPAQLQQFLKDGFPWAKSLFHFDRIVAFNVSLAEGRKMYDYVETTEFKEFMKEASFWASVWPVNGDNCTTVARKTLEAGSNKYAFLYPFGLPNTAFYTLRMRLWLRAIPYTIYTPPGPKPEIPEEVLKDAREGRPVEATPTN